MARVCTPPVQAASGGVVRHHGFWLIVTGTGRCGTGFIMKVLNSCGVKCTHERIFHPDLPSLELLAARKANPWWGWQAESSWLAAPFLDRPEVEGMTIVHLVRRPKPTIDSMIRQGGLGNTVEGSSYYAFSARHCPQALEIDDPCERMAYYYIFWNQMIEPHATLRWNVEHDVRGLLERLDIDYEGKDLYADTTYNTRPGIQDSDIDLNALPDHVRSPLREMSERYGYGWPRS